MNIDNKVHLHFVLHTAYSHTRITEFGGKYFPNRSLLFVFILFTEMVACDSVELRSQGFIRKNLADLHVERFEE